MPLDEAAQLVHAGDAVGHRDFQRLDLPARAVEEHDIALARRYALHRHAAAVARNDVGDFVVGDDHVVDVDVELDHVALVDGKRQRLGRFRRRRLGQRHALRGLTRLTGEFTRRLGE